MPMNDFAFVDGVVLVIIAVFFLRSFFNGALEEIFSLLSLGIAFLVSGKYGGLAQAWVEGWTGELRWISYAGHIGLFLAVWISVNLVGKLVSSLAQNSALGPWNRMGGGAIGVVKGAIIISSVVVLLDIYAPPSFAPPKDENSLLMPYVREIGAVIKNAAAWDVQSKMEDLNKAVDRDGAVPGGEARK